MPTSVTKAHPWQSTEAASVWVARKIVVTGLRSKWFRVEIVVVHDEDGWLSPGEVAWGIALVAS